MWCSEWEQKGSHCCAASVKHYRIFHCHHSVSGNVEKSPNDFFVTDYAVSLILTVLSLPCVPVGSWSYLNDLSYATEPPFDGNNFLVTTALCWNPSSDLELKGSISHCQSPELAALGPFFFSSASSCFCLWNYRLKQLPRNHSVAHISTWVQWSGSQQKRVSNWKALSPFLKCSRWYKCYKSAMYSN